MIRGTVAAIALLSGMMAPLPGMAQEIPVPEPRPEVAAPAVPDAVQARKEEADSAPVIHREACAALLSGEVAGKLVEPVREGECGEDSPLQLEKIAGIALTGDPLTRCGMAEGLARFAESAAVAAEEILGSRIETIVTGPGYECRRRNRAATGKLSEHAFANALDLAGFRLEDGREITVEAHWPHLPPAEPAGPAEAEGAGADTPAETAEEVPPEPAPKPAGERASTPEAKFLVKVRDAACGIFTTVLSPDSNSAHHSHLHFDLGCHGRDCTYLICE